MVMRGAIAFEDCTIDAGSELVIGPWSHTGLLDNRFGIKSSWQRSRFNHLTHIIRFFDRCCGRITDAATTAELATADGANNAGAASSFLRYLRL